MKKMVVLLTCVLLVAVVFVNNRKNESVTVNASRAIRDDIEITVRASGITMPKTEGNYKNLNVVLSVNENDISNVSNGSDVKLTFVAVPDKIFKGHVSEVSPYASRVAGLKTTTGYIDVKVEFDENYDEIKPGYSADGIIIGKKIEQAVLVPYDAVVTKNGEDFVWVAENGEAMLTPVETGVEMDFDTQITSGLDGGEIVVVNPPWQGTQNVQIENTGDVK